MGQGTGYTVLGKINSILNQYGNTKETVELVETTLDRLVSEDILTHWNRIEMRKGSGWVLYTQDNPDGIYINWNDKGQSCWPRDHSKVEEPDDE